MAASKNPAGGKSHDDDVNAWAREVFGEETSQLISARMAAIRAASGQPQTPATPSPSTDPSRSGLGFDAFGFDSHGAFARPRPKLLRKRSQRMTYVVRLDLDNVKPPIWRRLRLASDMPLTRLHDVIQAAMGWTDSHLHHFQMGPDGKDFQMTPFLTDFNLEEGEDDGVHEREIRLDQVIAKAGQRLFYEYDFGDAWHHTIKLEKVEPWTEDAPDAVCVAGRRACPPEDCGGIGGYTEILDLLAGKPGDHPEWPRHVLDWLPPDYDPAEFDVDEANDALDQGQFADLSRVHTSILGLLVRAGSPRAPLAQLIRQAIAEPAELTDTEVEAATSRYRHLLREIGDGVKLTQAGYLPPAIVAALANDLELIDPHWPYRPSREDKAPPVLRLRESAMACGLLRKANGRLLPTAAGRALVEAPRALFEHIQDRLPLGRRESEKDAGLLAWLFAATGRDLYQNRHEAAELFADLNWAASNGTLATALWFDSSATRDAINHLGEPLSSPDADARVTRALLRR